MYRYGNRRLLLARVMGEAKNSGFPGGIISMEKNVKRNTMIFAFLIAAVVSLVTNQAEAFRNEPEGFEGNTWGVSPDAIKNVVFSKISGVVPGIQYYRPDIPTQKSFFGINAYDFEYIFADGKFAGVSGKVNDRQSFDGILRKLKERHGFPEKVKPDKDMPGYMTYLWNGDKAAISMRFDHANRVGYISYNTKQLAVRVARQVNKGGISKVQIPVRPR